jgi:hypothetical protein
LEYSLAEYGGYRSFFRDAYAVTYSDSNSNADTRRRVSEQYSRSTVFADRR